MAKIGKILKIRKNTPSGKFGKITVKNIGDSEKTPKIQKNTEN